ncbi:MAG: Do family serine endopeptidase [Verrucomicrobia bacterium]|jgi:serine protease Do|nr:Do family serine endopeptidase [Verrucomicrobiota bacterium]
MKTKLWFYTTVAVMGCALIVAVLVTSAAAKESTPPKVTVSDRVLDREARGASYASIVKRVAPSVVNIYSTRTVRTRPFLHPFLDDPMFRRFYGDGFDPGERRSQTYKTQGLGSGVIVSEDGYILTNNHVIDEADKDGVEVALADGKAKYAARVVATDKSTDVAVLKIDAKNLKAITLADSDKLEVGDVVLAIGNPFGVGQSVSMGIISALGRGLGILGPHGYEDFIQTDAPINPGNSGGALVDTEGRLVGINQSILSGGSRANTGVGFAIPINLARNIMDRLVTDGKVTRGYLGVNIQPVTPELAKEFNLADEGGALVGEVRSDTPAAEAGLENGDVILEFNGKKVPDSKHLRLMVAQTQPKTKVTLKVIREGKTKTLTATLTALPDELAGGPRDEPSDRGEAKVDTLDGVEVTDLDARTRRQSDIPASVRGALVTNVDPDSTAAEAGLRAGDVVLEINRQPVRSADDAVELSKNAKGNRLLLRVWSNTDGVGGSRYVSIEAAKKK